MSSVLKYKSLNDNVSAAEGLGWLALGFAVVALWLTIIAAWITHVVVCIKASAWILLLFGCIVAPVGIIHGIGVWLGAF